MYNTFRNITGDVEDCKNIGWNISDIKKIKEHLFINELKLDDGIKVLDPDYEIAMAWKRLELGKFYE